MKSKIIHVLCEGQTEQGFVQDVLQPYLKAYRITSVKSILITTSKKKNAHGGMLTYSHAETDLNILMRKNTDGENERHVFTTMFDLYKLPNDFPGYNIAKNINDPYDCVKDLETHFSNAIADKRFIPYIQLHEFEALLFCGIEYLAKRYPNSKKQCEQLKKVLLEKDGNPELINDGESTAPSKRIIKAIEGETKKVYRYNKPKTGKDITKDIGIDVLRDKCKHFNEWIEKLLKA